MARVYEINSRLMRLTRLMRLIQTREFSHQQRNKKEKKEFWCCKWFRKKSQTEKKTRYS